MLRLQSPFLNRRRTSKSKSTARGFLTDMDEEQSILLGGEELDTDCKCMFREQMFDAFEQDQEKLEELVKREDGKRADT